MRFSTKNRSQQAFIMMATMLVLLTITQLKAQTTTNFTEIELEPESHYNGSDESGGFVSGHIFFPNHFTWWTPEVYSWSGFSVSNVTDNETPGFANQYSAFTGGGYGENKNYAIAYVSDPVTYANSIFLAPNGPAKGGALKDIVVTNTTYAALAMRDGDDFSKKFGGADGDDPDWFLLTLVGWRNGEAMEERKIEFYLADYRFEDNRENYIVDTWERISLEGIGSLDSLEIRLSSSDVGDWGMNTPAMFGIGQITTMDNEDTTNAPLIGEARNVNIYPNPFVDHINIQIPGGNISAAMNFRVFDATGRLIRMGLAGQSTSVDLSALRPGVYIVVVEGNNFRNSQRIIKK